MEIGLSCSFILSKSTLKRRSSATPLMVLSMSLLI